ncbi:MAG TPA: chorismate mutase [Bacteroidales bacterium]|nr:chorismate mutase [Bacteroidales bacterium]HRZ48825.1 chorismate mutase [Bacteroidales bacterium]
MKTPSKKLELYRRELQELDLQVLLLVSERFRLVSEMGTIKRQLKMEVLQEAEWQKKVEFLSAHLEENPFSSEVMQVFHEIHELSVGIQLGTANS